MNNDKKNALILVAVALGFIGYSYFLTTKIQDAETQINELKAIPVRPPEKKMVPGTIFKMPPMRYCEVGNHKRSVGFDGKDQFEYFNPGNDLVRGPFAIDKNTIVLTTSKTSQQELIIKSWDNSNNVTEFSFDGRYFNSSVCKTPEQERQENERIEQERLAKEKAEQDKIAAEKAEQEKIAAEKAEQEKLAAEKIEQEKIAAEKIEQERIAKEKAEQERLAAEKAAAEKAAAEKAAAEKAAAEKAAAEKAAAEKAAKEKLDKDKEKDDEEPPKKAEEAPAAPAPAPAKDDSSPFLFD